MEVNIKLTPKQEKMLRDYWGDDLPTWEWMVNLAKEKGITIEQQIEELKKADETDLEMTGDLLID